jgi:hypothetical protein
MKCNSRPLIHCLTVFVIEENSEAHKNPSYSLKKIENAGIWIGILNRFCEKILERHCRFFLTTYPSIYLLESSDELIHCILYARRENIC